MHHFTTFWAVVKLEGYLLLQEDQLLLLVQVQVLLHLQLRLETLDIRSVVLQQLHLLVQELLALQSEEEQVLAQERHASSKLQLRSSSFKTIRLTRKETSTSLS